MTYFDLVEIRENLLKEMREDTKVSDFANIQEYNKYLNSVEDGIIAFYCHSLLHILDKEMDTTIKKSA